MLGSKSACLTHSHHLQGPSLPSGGSSSSGSLWFCHPPLWCHPGVGQAVLILSAFCPRTLGQHCFCPESHTTIHKQRALGFPPEPLSRGRKTSPQAWPRLSSSCAPLILLALHFLPPPLLSAPAQSSPVEELLQTGTCRGQQPPRSVVSGGLVWRLQERALGSRPGVRGQPLIPPQPLCDVGESSSGGLSFGVREIQWF